MDTVGGEGGENWESSIETSMLPYVKLIASGNLLYDAGSSIQCSVTIYWGGMGWRREEGSRGREHMYTFGQFMLMYGRAQHNILKPLSFN